MRSSRAALSARLARTRDSQFRSSAACRSATLSFASTGLILANVRSPHQASHLHREPAVVMALASKNPEPVIHDADVNPWP
jgi:hypothetical protein